MTRRKNQIPQFVVLSRQDAEQYEPREKEICISIADPDVDPADVSSDFAAVLRLNFTDVLEAEDASDVLFSEDHVRAILEFIDAWPDARRIVVHCHAGISRSPGVALGLCDVRGWATAELERSHPGWNRLVRAALAANSPADRKLFRAV
ncbi:MAG: hypothetical protein QOD47_2103 [Gemmatimonadaceae bacterium]|jgi:predicted protein tyrosine phosphatase|nr:hypothetical protein [Gemmatimonadaceae bacterium]